MEKYKNKPKINCKMDLNTYLLIIFATLIITIIGTVIGFGTKVMIIALLTFFVGIREAIILAAIYSIIQYIFRLWLFHKSLNKPLLKKMTLYLIPGILIGLAIFKYVDTKILIAGFSMFLLLFVLYKLTRIKLQFNLNEIGLGISIFFFGILESAIGGAGPLLGISLLQYGKRKERFVVFAAGLFLISAILRFIGYTSMGYFKLSSSFLAGLLIIAGIVGTYIGKSILKRTPEKIFEYVIIAALFLIAIRNLFF